MHLIRIDDELAQRAGALAELHALRGDDAVHLATALSVNDPDLVLTTWDGDLACAASSAGITVVSSRN